MNKEQLVACIVTALARDLAIAERAAQTAYEAATHEENIAENKYDTLGLEASYLATGQARRMAEIRQALTRLKDMPVRDHQSDLGIQVGDYVELETPDGSLRCLFLAPDAAGLSVRDQERSVTVITPNAPLGRALLRQAEGEEIDVQVAGRLQRYWIVRAC